MIIVTDDIRQSVCIIGGNMIEFVKKNLVWVSIFLCIAGVVLSVIGIPTQQPLFFFVGIILALPTIAYILYQVFFDKGQAEIDLRAAEATKPTTNHITTVLEKKEDLLLMNNETNEDEEVDVLEPFYNGYASQEEIAMHLAEITKAERERAIDDSPADVIPAVTPEPEIDQAAVEIATQGELFRQREIEQTNPGSNRSDDTLVPAATHEAPAVSTPEVHAEPTTPMLAEQTYQTVIKINPMAGEIKKQRAQEKKALLQQSNLEKYLQHYFLETAACFLLDRNIYKDNNGIAPYNKFAANKDTGLPEYSMACTKGRLYKFCTYLLDAERFMTHPSFYNDFITAIESGVPLARISETLHPLYRKNKKEFVLNLSNREDWDNVMILVYNNYLLNNDNFKDVFIRIPFEIPVAYNEQNITDYLNDIDVQDRFMDKYPALSEMGIPTVWEALYIGFVNSIKQKLSIEQLENAILRDHKKIARSLKRTYTARQKALKKAS